ncbi:hypothetical protein HD806DRAFT_525117 [Xylariaceae sp. AK1471]|nr:hypothetical protein HD806DRAFT_525117 [Xylariaceae sp. AK1471]
MAQTRREGYARLSSFMAAHPEFSIFRRFAALNTLNLLHMQAELKILEHHLQEKTQENASSRDIYKSMYDRDWETLSTAPSDDPNDPNQWEIVQKMRQKLREYNETLALLRTVYQMGPPSRQDLKFLQSWMQTPRMGNVFLLGLDRNIWEETDLSELLCLRPRASDSWFTKFVMDRLIQLYHYSIGKFFKKPDDADYHGNTVHYSEKRLSHLVTVFVIALASVLPVLAILALYLVSSMIKRLVLIGVFEIIFAIGLGFFTNGRMIEIFAATTA